MEFLICSTFTTYTHERLRTKEDTQIWMRSEMAKFSSILNLLSSFFIKLCCGISFTTIAKDFRCEKFMKHSSILSEASFIVLLVFFPLLSRSLSPSLTLSNGGEEKRKEKIEIELDPLFRKFWETLIDNYWTNHGNSINNSQLNEWMNERANEWGLNT